MHYYSLFFFLISVRYIVTSSVDNLAKIWDATTFKLVRTLTGHTHEIVDVAFFTDDKYVSIFIAIRL